MKTDKQIKAEIDQLESELLSNPSIDEDVKKTITAFREWAERFPKAVNNLLEFVKNQNSNNLNEKSWAEQYLKEKKKSLNYTLQKLEGSAAEHSQPSILTKTAIRSRMKKQSGII